MAQVFYPGPGRPGENRIRLQVLRLRAAEGGGAESQAGQRFGKAFPGLTRPGVEQTPKKTFQRQYAPESTSSGQTNYP